MRRTLGLATLLAATLMVACGGAPDLPDSSQVSVTITPARATIQVGQTVDLQGVSTGFTNPTLTWWMQDQHDANPINGSEDCDDIYAANANLIPTCRFGYLTDAGIVEAKSDVATYHAPNTPGTYHVTLRAMQMSTEVRYASVEATAAATITVNP